MAPSVPALEPSPSRRGFGWGSCLRFARRPNVEPTCPHPTLYRKRERGKVTRLIALEWTTYFVLFVASLARRTLRSGWRRGRHLDFRRVLRLQRGVDLDELA